MSLLIVAGCAKKPVKKLPSSKPPTTQKAPEQPTPEIQKTLSPKRGASQRLVQIGQNYLETGQTDKAVQTFQEAINIDFENGSAYFYLSKSLYMKGSYDDALSILERAETFLLGQENWADKIGELRTAIKEAKALNLPPPGEKPLPQQPQGVYY